MVTIEQLKEGVRKQSNDAANLITRYQARFKDEGDLKYLEWIQALELVIKSNELVLEKTDWDDATQEEIQSYYNVLLSHENYFQSSN